MEGRERHLDGIRGTAALVVAVFHFIRAFAPESLAGGSALLYTPLSAFWNGHFAVQVFFVLSGFLFYLKFAAATAREAFVGAVKRYFRLSVPALAVCLAAWAIHAAGGFANARAGEMLQAEWLLRWYRFEPDLTLAISEPLLTMYTSFDAYRSYNANLWTIRYELFVVWGVIALAAARRVTGDAVQLAMLAAAGILTCEGYAFAFVAGALAGWVRLHWSTMRMPLWAGVAALAAALSLGSYRLPDLPWGWVWPMVVWPLAAALMIGSIDASPALRAALSRRPFQWLGRHSFGMYLAHFVVVSSLAAGVLAATRSLAWTLVAYALGTVLAAMAFTHAIDAPSQRMLNRFLPRGSPARTSPAP